MSIRHISILATANAGGAAPSGDGADSVTGSGRWSDSIEIAKIAELHRQGMLSDAAFERERVRLVS